MVWTIIFYLIVGAIIGLLGKFVAPGDKDNIPLWLTIVCGIGGMILGRRHLRALRWRRQQGPRLDPRASSRS